jgi:hypothetical protein
MPLTGTGIKPTLFYINLVVFHFDDFNSGPHPSIFQMIAILNPLVVRLQFFYRDTQACVFSK